jgi:hypothetical protein
MIPSRRDARIAGWLYLLFIIPGPFCLIYVPGKIMVPGDPGATAAHVLGHDMLLRVSVLIWLFAMVVWILLALALYRLFSGIGKGLASSLVIFVAISAGIGFFNELNNLAAILVLGSREFALILSGPQRAAIAMLFLRLHGLGNTTNQIFWGLWLLPFGLLVIRSRFIPRWLGIWLLLDGFAWLGLGMVTLLAPSYNSLAFKVAQPAMLAELAVMLWLMMIGVRVPAIERNAAPVAVQD